MPKHLNLVESFPATVRHSFIFAFFFMSPSVSKYKSYCNCGRQICCKKKKRLVNFSSLRNKVSYFLKNVTFIDLFVISHQIIFLAIK